MQERAKLIYLVQLVAVLAKNYNLDSIYMYNSRSVYCRSVRCCMYSVLSRQFSDPFCKATAATGNFGPDSEAP